MYKRLLVPLDGSELAETALPYAEEIARHYGSEVILLHVLEPAEDPDNPEHRVYLSKKATETEQDIKKSSDKPLGEKVKVTSAITGSPGISSHAAEEILDYAAKENISLVVMATHGTTGIRRWVLGSTANKVASAFKCPLLLVRANVDMSRKVHLEKILVPLDGSRPSEAVLPYIENLASRVKPRISLLNVVEIQYHIYSYAEEPGYYGSAGIVRIPFTEAEMKPFKLEAEKYVKGVSAKLAGAGIKATYEVKSGSPGEEIIKAEEALRPDLVAMSTHGHSGFGRFDHGSVTDKVLHTGITPLLLVRPG